MDLQANQVLTILLFIIIVYVCYTFYNRDDTFMTIMLGVLGAAFLGLLYCCSGFWPEKAKRTTSESDTAAPAEHMRDFGALDRETHSVYDNISNSQDAEFARNDKDFALGLSNAPFDNSDIVERVIEGSSTHMPLESSSSSFYDVHDRVFNRGIGGADGDESNYNEYRVPLQERAMDMDDKLSRKQQHRAAINEKAINGAVRATRKQFERYFSDELAQTENFEWWGDEDGDGQLETDYKTY